MTVVHGISYAPGHAPAVPSFTEGTVVVDDAGRRWEFVRVGCATGSTRCKHAPGSATVHALDAKGRRRYSMTECVNGYDLSPAETP